MRESHEEAGMIPFFMLLSYDIRSYETSGLRAFVCA